MAEECSADALADDDIVCLHGPKLQKRAHPYWHSFYGVLQAGEMGYCRGAYFTHQDINGDNNVYNNASACLYKFET